jgi:hypothetical protein
VRKMLIRFAIFLSILFIVLGCSSSRGLPPASGEYEIKANSLTWDGSEYEFFWKDGKGELHRASADKLKMVEDTRTYLEMSEAEPVVHLAKEDPVAIRGEDHNGSFTTPWFPFFLGTMMGGGLGGPVVINQPYPGSPPPTTGRPTYHYPPTDTFGRDESLHGSVTNNKPAAPDYNKVKPAPYSVSGQSGGTGGGTAASNKSTSVSGQSGGTGSGSAASNKGGFASGSSSFRSKSGGSTGGSGALGSSSTRKGGAPSGISGGKSSGGFKGGGVGRRR